MKTLKETGISPIFGKWTASRAQTKRMKTGRKVWMTLAIGLAVTTGLLAQDPHLSQFYAAPLEVNPALSGVFKGKFRINTNYRSQWGSITGTDAFRTLGLTYDMRFRGVGDGDFFSFNFHAIRDEAGAAKLSLTKGVIGMAYHKKMWDGRLGRTPQYLIVGGQAGFGQYAINAGSLWFSSQFNQSTGTVDPGLPTNEPWVTNAAPHFDFNVGGLWYSVLGEDFSIYAGAALFHINQPNISFYDDRVPLYRKWTAYVGGQVPVTRELSILPSAMAAYQGPSFQTVFGSHIRYSNRDWWEIAIRAGLFARISNKLSNDIHNDAVIFNTTFEVERWRFGVSYDMNVSSLQPSTNRRGAFELSGSYVHPLRAHRHAIECPKF